MWGLQIAFLNPVLALLLVVLYDATPGEVGWVLAIYNNASGFVCSLLVPAYTDRRADYLRPMLICAVMTVTLAAALALATSLSVAVIALILLGGPAGVASTLLYAHLAYAGVKPAEVVRTRAIVSVAGVGGPPLATGMIGWLGHRAILAALAAVGVLTISVTAAMLRHEGRRRSADPRPARRDDDDQTLSRVSVGVIVVAFVALQAGNAAVVSVMSLYVTESLGLAVVWAGITLGVAAGLEVPALMLIARMSRRYSNLTLIASGCFAGLAYYMALIVVTGPVMLIAFQVLNAWLFAAIAGTGLTLFQQIIPRPGLASGLYMNTRRVGAIVSGPAIGLGGVTALGYGAVLVACAVLNILALILVFLVARRTQGCAPTW